MSIVANLINSCSHSSRSGVGTSGLSSLRGMQFSSGLGGGRSGTSVFSVGSSPAPSVNRGAGEYYTRISQSSFSMDGPGQITIVRKSDGDVDGDYARCGILRTILRKKYHFQLIENETWQSVLQSQITTSTTEVKTFQSQVTDLKRTFQSLEIELHGLLTQHVETRQEVRKVIMDEKDQEEQQVQKVVEEYNPHKNKRMRVIVKEKVVSTIVDKNVQEMNGLRGRDSSRIC
uniref:IF rod domain-containing protein n=1 Tax=Hucho hucho TaxID=62062 RepID=A0A4W5KCQ8_9TELE